MPDSSLFLPVRFSGSPIGIHQRFQGVDFISCDSNGRKASRGMALRSVPPLKSIRRSPVLLHDPPGSAPAVCWHYPANVDFTAGVTAFQTF